MITDNPCRSAILVLALSLLFMNSTSIAEDNKDDSKAALLRTFSEEFVSITPGKGKYPASFQMGSARGHHEQPRHEVTFGYDFAVAKYEVPQDLYEAVMGNNPSRWKGPRNSVEMITWSEANLFCSKATVLLRDRQLIADNEFIRLPTEAEWEYCCRAGTNTQYSFGENADDGKAAVDVILTSVGQDKDDLLKIIRSQTKLDDKDANEFLLRLPKPIKVGASKEEAAKLTEEIEAAGGTCKTRKAILLDQYGWHTGNAAGNDPPVGALKPNPWGLYDMHGYLSEFTADAWADDYQNAPADGSAVPVKGDGKSLALPANSSIVLRSGSWKDKFDYLTSGSRRKYSISDADDAIGFRCVKAKTSGK